MVVKAVVMIAVVALIGSQGHCCIVASVAVVVVVVIITKSLYWQLGRIAQGSRRICNFSNVNLSIVTYCSRRHHYDPLRLP